MVSGEALKKLQEQIAAWPMMQRFVVQQLIRDYLMAREDVRAYEDTGLTPDEIKSMKDEHFSGLEMAKLHSALMELKKYQEADKDGRLVVLPCKVGDVVYGFHNGQTILPMVAKWVETSADGWTIAVQYTPMAPNFYLFSDFGKTVFLTREEAEKALEAMKDV